MIKLCIGILCGILIFITWRTEFLARKVRRLESELEATKDRLHNLQEDIREFER